MAFEIPQPSFIEHIIASQTDWFELMVLKCILSDREFRSRALKVLCLDATTGKPVKDFTSDIDNALYQAISTFVLCTGGRVEMPLEFAHSILRQMGDQATLLGASEVEIAVARYMRCRELELQAALPLVRSGFKIWLAKRRAERVIRAHTSTSTWNADDMINETRRNTVAIDMAAENETFFEFGHGVDTVALDIKRKPILGFKALNDALGGGGAPGEGTLIVAPQGSGKTILGCKIASTLSAKQEQVGIFISTEQDHPELEPRVIAAHCNISFDMIKDGFNPKMPGLRPEQIAAYERLREELKDRMFWEDWGNADHGRSIEHDLLEVIDRRQDQIGKKVDYIVLDWIGGALGRLSGNDGDKLTFIMKLAGDTVCQISKDRQLMAFAFAQASMASSVNTKRVDASKIANCKSLGEKFTNGIGLTMMYEEGQQLQGDDEPIYSNRQWLYAFKGRKSKGGCYPFFRRFAYQDMKDITWRPGPGG